MTTPYDLVSRRVVVGRFDERLADVAPRITLGGTHHCVVLADDNRRFGGLIQLADIVGRANAGGRILADLVSPVQPVLVRPHDTAAHIADLFERHHLTEAVLIEADETYVGLITAQSVMEWSRAEYRRAETDLGEALERASQASRAKDNFMAAVSHELRTPLTPVLLVASGAAANPNLPPELQRDFKMIAEHVAQEANLVDELIEQGELLRGNLVVELTQLDLHALLKEITAKIQPQMESKQVSFSLELTRKDPLVAGERRRLSHVFGELLSNAIRFTPPQGRVQVATVLREGGAFVEVRISDTGVGFSAEQIARMFEPFGQPARPPGSLGLGLSIARGLVEMHGGELRVESLGRDKGATFAVTLPLWSDATGKDELRMRTFDSPRRPASERLRPPDLQGGLDRAVNPPMSG